MTPTGTGADEDPKRISAISAPYNFVPLADWVHVPSWGHAVAHDLPLQDGYCGEIVYTLTAHTPLLVGGSQIKAQNGQPREVRPFRLPGGAYAIPGSSLKGMLRAVVEIAGFGRMSMIDDVRPGLREIAGDFVRDSYARKIQDRVKTGFLRRRGDGSLEIVPCRMARVEHRLLEAALNVTAPIFPVHSSVAQKYQRWDELCRNAGRPPERVSFDLGKHDACICLPEASRELPY